MNFQTLKFKLTIFLAFGFIISSSSTIWGQRLPNVQVRFANPQFDKASQIYSLDVEMRSSSAGEQLFGMNVRFFYDAAQLTFSHFDDFQQGYGILGKTPKANKGNSQSGYQMFRFYEAAAYVNAAVQLLQSETSVAMSPGKWVRYFRAHFTVNDIEMDNEAFAPSLIWDLRSSPKGEEYLSGSDGVVLTVVEHDPGTREESAPAKVEALPFNWVQTSKTRMPYGHPVAVSKLSLLNKPLDLGKSQVMDNGLPQLQQNQPNPFYESTDIKFYLPETAVARISIFDVTGRLVRVLENDYPAGYNSVVIDKSELNQGADVFFYRLESNDYVSPMKKMILLTR